MAKEAKEKTKAVKTTSFDTLQASYFSGKVKPTLNKINTELANDPKNLPLILLACQCLLRTKNFDQLSITADQAIKLDKKNGKAYYYKGVALQHSKGKEQEALKNFDQALAIDPDNTIYLKDKAATHLLLFKDFHLPIKLAEKHKDKGEESLLKIISLIEGKETPNYLDYLTIGDVSITISRNLDAKKYYFKAVNDFNKLADDEDKDMNIYKDIIKAQKACIKLMEKFIE